MPSASSARTTKVCEPSARAAPPLSALSGCGLEQVVKAPESSLHCRRVYEASENARVALVALALGFTGFEPRAGAVVSTVHVYAMAGPVKDPWIARTLRVWVPFASPLYPVGLEQEA